MEFLDFSTADNVGNNAITSTGVSLIHVLLVDDDKYLQNVYKTLFAVGNFKITAQAYDGQEAVSTYDEMDPKPDVVLMDQRMPKMDGITATKKIKEIDPDVKIVFLSADDESKSLAFNAGASAFLSKPVRIEVLFETIETVIKG